MPPEDRIRLAHMLEAISDAQAFMLGRSRPDLDNDKMLVYAVLRAVEIVGEAASKVTADTQLAAPQIPWPAIVGMRHRLVHAYARVDLDIVWKTVQHDLPPLKAAIEAALA
jgi:uncharacterized protein with HEPN domain